MEMSWASSLERNKGVNSGFGLCSAGWRGWDGLRSYFFLKPYTVCHSTHRNPVIKRVTERMRSKTKMRNEACVWFRVGVTITEQSHPDNNNSMNCFFVFYRRVPDSRCCSGPTVVLSLVLNLIPSKSDQSLLPNWAICMWAVTNKNQSVAFSTFIYLSPTFRNTDPDVICRVDS